MPHGEPCNQLRPRRRSCNCSQVHGHERDARELRSVAPLLVEGQLVGAVTLVRNGDKVIGATDPELLRAHVGAKLSVATMLDGSANVAVSHWGLSRTSTLALVELAAPIETGLDVRVLDLGAVSGSLDTRGVPAALVGIVQDGAGFARSFVPVQVDKDPGGMSDAAPRLASPIDEAHVGTAVAGGALFAWFPPDPALGRASEVLVIGLTQPYRGFGKPREHPAIAEIVGLDDLGRALLVAHKLEEREPELRQVAGEIEARGAPEGRTPEPRRPKPGSSS